MAQGLDQLQNKLGLSLFEEEKGSPVNVDDDDWLMRDLSGNFFKMFYVLKQNNSFEGGNVILLPKLFQSTMRKNCYSDRERVLKFEAEGREFANILRSQEQFIQTVKGLNNFWYR